MPKFVVERNFPEPLDMKPDEAGREFAKQIQSCNASLGAKWLFSFLSSDGKKLYCIDEAPDADALREAARQLNIPADVVTEVSDLRPEMFA